MDGRIRSKHLAVLPVAPPRAARSETETQKFVRSHKRRIRRNVVKNRAHVYTGVFFIL